MVHSLQRRVEKLEEAFAHGPARAGWKVIFREISDAKLERFLEILWGFGEREDPGEHLVRGETPETLARWCEALGARPSSPDRVRATFLAMTKGQACPLVGRGGGALAQEWEDGRSKVIQACNACKSPQRLGPFIAHLQGLSCPG